MKTEEFFADLEKLLLAQRAEVEATILNLQEQITENKVILRKYDGMLKAAGLEVNHKPKQRRYPRDEPKATKTVLTWLEVNDREEGWTSKQVADAIGIHRSTTGHALRYLRDNNKIRAVRKVQGGGYAYAAWHQ